MDNKHLPSAYLLLAIVCLALIVRIAFILQHPHRTLGVDPRFYDDLAQNLLENGEFAFLQATDLRPTYPNYLQGPTAYSGPVYPTFLAGIYRVFGHEYRYVYLVQALISAVTCLLIFSLGKKLYNQRVSVMASLLAVFQQYFLIWVNTLYIETLQIFLIVLLFLILFKIPRIANSPKGPLASGFAGIVLGLATLNQPQTVLLYPFILGWFWVKSSENRLIRQSLVVRFRYIVYIKTSGFSRKKVFTMSWNSTPSHLCDGFSSYCPVADSELSCLQCFCFH